MPPQFPSVIESPVNRIFLPSAMMLGVNTKIAKTQANVFLIQEFVIVAVLCKRFNDVVGLNMKVERDFAWIDSEERNSRGLE